VAQLKAYDEAFGGVLRAAQSRWHRPEQLIVYLHGRRRGSLCGGAPTPANCDGVNVPCFYPQIGKADVNLNGLVAAQSGDSTKFSIHFDMAPTVSVIGNPPFTGSVARQLERDLASHGGIQPEIAQTWLGLVGPGVLHGAARTDDEAGIQFSDHTDIRPTHLLAGRAYVGLF
jgi:hypothetical protein